MNRVLQLTSRGVASSAADRDGVRVIERRGSTRPHRIAPVRVASTKSPVAPPARHSPRPIRDSVAAWRGRHGRWKVVVAAAAVLAFIAGAYVFFHRAPRLTDKDTIVLADFTNTTGDPVFDGTLRQGLAVQLAQSPFLSLVSEERIRQALRLMGRPADARLTPELARDICERTASAAVLDG